MMFSGLSVYDTLPKVKAGPDPGKRGRYRAGMKRKGKKKGKR